MASFDWNRGWVHPADGLNTNNGFGYDSPLRTIEEALSRGFEHIRIAAGSHTISDVESQLIANYSPVLELCPGTHNFLNAPLTCYRPYSVVASNRRPPALDGTGAVKITAPSTVPYYFFWEANPATDAQVYAHSIRGLWFDMSKISNVACEFGPGNMIRLHDSIGYSTGWTPRYLFEVNTNTGGDNSWQRVLRNIAYNCGFFYSTTGRGKWTNRWTLRDNVCFAPNSDATVPFVWFEKERHQGMLFEGNTFRGVSSSATAAVLIGRSMKQHWIGNFFADINTASNLAVDYPASTGDWPVLETISSTFVHCRGINAAGGTVRVNGTTAPSGADTYESTNEIRTDIVDWNNNL